MRLALATLFTAFLALVGVAPAQAAEPHAWGNSQCGWFTVPSSWLSFQDPCYNPAASPPRTMLDASSSTPNILAWRLAGDESGTFYTLAGSGWSNSIGHLDGTTHGVVYRTDTNEVVGEFWIPAVDDEIEDPTGSSTPVDTDGDGISDEDEVAAGTDPTKADTDGDGVPDGEDPDPLDPDVDGDCDVSISDPSTWVCPIKKPIDSMWNWVQHFPDLWIPDPNSWDLDSVIEQAKARPPISIILQLSDAIGSVIDAYQIDPDSSISGYCSRELAEHVTITDGFDYLRCPPESTGLDIVRNIIAFGMVVGTGIYLWRMVGESLR